MPKGNIGPRTYTIS